MINSYSAKGSAISPGDNLIGACRGPRVNCRRSRVNCRGSEKLNFYLFSSFPKVHYFHVENNKITITVA